MEILALVAALGLFVIYLVWRRNRIRRGLGTFRCWLLAAHVDETSPLVADGSRGKAGTAHYSATSLQWWWDLSPGLKPSQQWSRRALEVIDKVDSSRAGQDHVRIRCRVATDRVVELEMSRNAYNGFTSWLEATPTIFDWVI